MTISRRRFIAGAAAAVSFATFTRAARALFVPSASPSSTTKSHRTLTTSAPSLHTTSACKWIELRSACGAECLTDLPDADLERARTILAKYNLRVTDIASPLFKTDWPGAPLSKLSEHRDQFKADFTFQAGGPICSSGTSPIAKTFGTDRIRCFDFWRLDNVAPYRAAINEKLRDAARRCGRSNLILLLENEMSCNTATGEGADTHRADPSRNPT